jgi:hypothetical protein
LLKRRAEEQKLKLEKQSPVKKERKFKLPKKEVPPLIIEEEEETNSLHAPDSPSYTRRNKRKKPTFD